MDFDRENCVECKECLKACPQLEENLDFSIFKCDQCGECIENCPEGAIKKIDDAVVIDYEKCNNCMQCVDFCKKGAIINDNGIVKKCDLCYDRNELKCKKACIYDCFKEKTDDLGWRITGNSEYNVNRKNIKADGIKLINWVLKQFRERYDKYDELGLIELAEHYCEKNISKISEKKLDEILQIIEQEVKGYSIIDELLKDDELEEISASKKGVFVYHKKRGWIKTNIEIDEKKIIEISNKMGRNIGRRLTTKKPMINTKIKNGRVHSIKSPISKNTVLTIRLFSKNKFTENDFKEIISDQALTFLKMACQCNTNIIIAGNTGSGKTSLLNLILDFFDKNERIILVEETPELRTSNENSISLVVNKDLNVGMAELVTETLRMRPDRLIVGEIRGPDEVKAFVNTMLAGQGKGSIATFHAESAEECLTRLEALGARKADMEAIDLIVLQKRWTDIKEGREVRKVFDICTINKGRVTRIFEREEKKLAAKQLENKVSEKIKRSYGISQKKLEELINERAIG